MDYRSYPAGGLREAFLRHRCCTNTQPGPSRAPPPRAHPNHTTFATTGSLAYPPTPS